MKIITYIATDPATPENARACAHILTDTHGWSPVRIFGATPEEARATAQEFWNTELERFRKLDGRKTKDPMVRLDKTLNQLTALLETFDAD